MPTLKAIRNRIRSVKSTQQITRAMKMVSAAKLRRAQEAALSARPYAEAMARVLTGVAGGSELGDHPLMKRREVARAEFVVLTSNRGLCGGFNANVTRRVQRFLIQNDGKLGIDLRTIGRKGHDLFKRRGYVIRTDHSGLLAKLSFPHAHGIAEELTRRYLGGEVDVVYLVYNRLVSQVTTEVVFRELLPMGPPGVSPEPATYPPPPPRKPAASVQDYLFEPDREAVLENLLPRFLANEVWQAILESVAAEHAARMTAMENATGNAAELIGRLTLLYNRSRQAAITKELMEIVSGAEALK